MPKSPPKRRGPGRPKDFELQERRRVEILEVAAGCFANYGFPATDMQVVADRAGIGKGTIYRYFANKEELFLAAVDQGMRGLSEAISEAAARSAAPLERLELGIRGYLDYFDRHSQVIELLIQERAYFRERETPTYFAHRDANLRPWRELVERLISAGQIRKVPVDRVTDVISDLLYGTIFTNFFAKRKKSLASQCKDVIDIVFRGVLTEGAAPHG